MRINAHTHIFNLASVFSSETLEILLRRVTEVDVPEVFKNDLQSLLEEALAKAGGYAEVESLVDAFVKKAALAERLKALDSGNSVALEFLGADEIAKAGALTLVEKLKKALSRDDAGRHNTIGDLLDFVLIGLKPGISAVTAHIMEQLDEDDFIVALMMDITSGGSSDADLFEGQIQETSEQVLRYPGRVLPFIAVNPLREGHRHIMERALLFRGFVGVKLYPSLGYDVDSPEMHAVYDFCHPRGIPILMHCTPGGFYAKEASRGNSEPRLWEPILKNYKGLKVCFGHFGGGENLCGAEIPPDSWTSQILSLMRDPDNTGVYADISFHTELMEGGDGQANYIGHLKELLKDPVTGSRILFGTDFWLVRTALSEANHWQFFEEALDDEDLFKQLTATNPCGFLGIGHAPGTGGENMRHYVQFIKDHRGAMNPVSAATWLKDELQAQGTDVNWTTTTPNARWNANNEAHVRLFWYLRDNQMGKKDRTAADFYTDAYFSVTRLQYWNKGFESSSIFYRKCGALAKGMDRYFRESKATYEENTTRAMAVEKLIAVLSNEGSVFVDLASLCDELYDFSTEGA
ncbi:amidohydrolase family protein [Desulfoluna spongiiphila]|uniref:Predicted metal-dependent hydrolase, TIM-barrel fold n=1 Tax=Desulfoluna spongiiphila TaxID=419481 RepID=A0A1G5JR08_9BACT|nr:amidohydrolase family protein [Desulfoluna spongiiphila]SCY90833.1 Predicted metal-dependent hydrolase, TIM-barrel fold [Desulfoluna spongiiphila]